MDGCIHIRRLDIILFSRVLQALLLNAFVPYTTYTTTTVHFIPCFPHHCVPDHCNVSILPANGGFPPPSSFACLERGYRAERNAFLTNRPARLRLFLLPSAQRMIKQNMANWTNCGKLHTTELNREALISIRARVATEALQRRSSAFEYQRSRTHRGLVRQRKGSICFKRIDLVVYHFLCHPSPLTYSPGTSYACDRTGGWSKRWKPQCSRAVASRSLVGCFCLCVPRSKPLQQGK